MNYWLFKTEPAELSIDDLAREPNRAFMWDGVRNYQARNFLRDQVKQGDQVLIYHSSCAVKGVAGIAEVVNSAYPDPSQFNPESVYFDPKATIENPRWIAVDVRYVTKLQQVITLDKIKSSVKMEQFPLVQRGNRLSIMPVTASQWRDLLALKSQA